MKSIFKLQTVAHRKLNTQMLYSKKGHKQNLGLFSSHHKGCLHYNAKYSQP